MGGNLEKDIDSLFDLLREQESKNNDRHTEVVRELTEIKSTMPKQPCHDTMQVRKDFDSHILEHAAQKTDLKGVVLRVVATVIVFMAIGVLGYAAKGFIQEIRNQEKQYERP